MSRPFLRNVSYNRYKYTYVKSILVNEFEFNTNTYTSNIRHEFEMYLFPVAHGSYLRVK